MIRWQTVCLWTAFMIQTSLATPAYTDVTMDDSFCHSNDCGGDTPCKSWCGELIADFLWWKPCIDNVDYVQKFTFIEDTGANESLFLSKFKNIPLDWEPGVRIRGGLFNGCSNWGVTASWTYIDIHDTASTPLVEQEDQIVFYPTVTFPQLPFFAAKASWKACYHDWDVLASYRHCCGKCHLITPYLGIAGIVFNQRLKEKLVAPNNDMLGFINWEDDYWGVGFRLGIDYEYAISQCFKFFTRADGSILAGQDNRNDLSLSAPLGNSIIINESEEEHKPCRVVPGFHIAAGFAYDVCLCNVDILLRLGYEFVDWQNMPYSRLLLPSGPTIPSPTNTRTLAFHGLLAGLALKF